VDVVIWKPYDGPMVTTLSLPDDLHAQLRAVADEEHRSVNATIVVAVERYVGDRNRRSRVRELAAEVARRDAELLDRLAQ
jgi:predicted transcriptional regulator